MERTLYGTYSNNVCAYCRLHNCAVTVKQLKKKECLKKECWHLEKNEQHQYWQQRERVKHLREERKQALRAL